jgi:hypothetical protein
VIPYQIRGTVGVESAGGVTSPATLSGDETPTLSEVTPGFAPGLVLRRNQPISPTAVRPSAPCFSSRCPLDGGVFPANAR